MNKTFDSKLMASILYNLRAEKGITQKQVEKDLNISQGLVSHYETGRNALSLDLLYKYAEYFDVSADYIMGRTDDKFNYANKMSKTLCDGMKASDVLNILFNMPKKELHSMITILKKWDE